MNPTNPQKLISTFLILATAVSSSVFIFVTNESSVAVQTGNSQIADKLPANAFADESIKQIAGFSTYDTVAIQKGSRRDNLTDYFAEKLLGQLAEDNDGVSLANSETGTSFVLPDMTKGIDHFLKDPQVALISSVDSKDIKMIRGADSRTIDVYFQNVNTIIDEAKYEYLSKLKTYSRQGATEASFNSLNFILSNAVAKLYNVKVPEVATDYHSALIKSLKTHAGLSGVGTDPLRSYFHAKEYLSIVEMEKRIVSNATSDLNEKLAYLNNKQKDGIFVEYFGIRRVQAITVFDIPNTIQGTISAIFEGEGVYNDILNYVLKIATEVLKDQLIHKLVQQTITWANNGFNGKPQYVENFGKVLNDAAKSAGDRVLSDAMTKFNGGACPTLKPLLEITFEGTAVEAGVGNTEGYGCTIDQMGANIDDFKNSFSNGGWIAYRSMLTNPQGTYFGAYMDLSDKISQEQEKKAEETKQEVSTGGGFLNMKQCKNRNVATGADAAQFATVAEAKSSLGDAFVSATCPAGGPCTEVVACEASGTESGWETTTPGQIAGQAVKDSLGKSPIDRIVNANDITGLVSALVNAALTKIVNLGQDGLAGLTNKELERKDGSVADACAGSEDPEKCKEEIGGATKEVDNQKAQKVGEDLKKMMSGYSEIAATQNEIFAGASQAKFYLEQASSTCSATFSSSMDSDVLDAQFYVIQNYDYVVGKITDAEAGIKGITDPGGIMDSLSLLSNAVAEKDLAALEDANSKIGLGITPTGETDDEKISDFLSKLADQMKSASSAFGNKFSTVYELPRIKGDLKSESLKIADDSCSILYTAKRINPDPNSCRLSPATADCKAPKL